MVRACRGAGAVLRPNSSLAGVAGSSDLASGGSGWGLSVPLSCAVALEGASKAASANAAPHAAIPRANAPLGAVIVVMLASRSRILPPLGAYADSSPRRTQAGYPARFVPSSGMRFETICILSTQVTNYHHPARLRRAATA